LTRTRKWRVALATALALVLALGMGACGKSDKKESSTAGPAGQPGKGKPPVKLGTKNFPEAFVLGQLYKQALEAKGYTVQFKNNIGSTEIIDKALTSGQIDVYPEYSGEIVLTVAGEKQRPKTAAETYAAAKAFQEKRGFTLLDETPFFDTDALAVKPEFAQKHGLRSDADLKKLKHFTYGAPPENKTRFTGAVGMKKVYGLDNFTFKPLAIGLQYKALDQGQIDVADVFTTDGQLQGGKYAVLTDPKAVFGFQNAVPVVKKSVLTQMGPAFAQTLNAVSSKLTLEAMRKMNGAVSLDKQDPAKIADQFLKANGLK
jgi:osmoprotectant transport system substrate-binding protein